MQYTDMVGASWARAPPRLSSLVMSPAERPHSFCACLPARLPDSGPGDLPDVSNFIVLPVSVLFRLQTSLSSYSFLYLSVEGNTCLLNEWVNSGYTYSRRGF